MRSDFEEDLETRLVSESLVSLSVSEWLFETRTEPKGDWKEGDFPLPFIG